MDDGEDVEQAAAQEQCDEGGGADGSLELEGEQTRLPTANRGVPPASHASASAKVQACVLALWSHLLCLLSHCHPVQVCLRRCP